MRLQKITLGKTVITGAVGAQTLGSVLCSDLTAGMSNGTQTMVDVLVELFDNVPGTAYATLYRLTAPLLLTAGPTYTLGTVAVATLCAVGAAASAATLDINAGNLRVRITPNNDNLDGYAIVEAYGP